MAFVPEDGTGLADANSFVSVPYADEYFADRADIVWAAITTDNKQANLIKATDLIATLFGPQFEGYPSYAAQALPFPRTGITDRRTPWGVFYAVDYMPTGLLLATCELAKIADKFTFSMSSADELPQLIEKTTGPIKKKYAELDRNASSRLFPYSYIRSLLQPYLTGGTFLKTRRV